MAKARILSSLQRLAKRFRTGRIPVLRAKNVKK